MLNAEMLRAFEKQYGVEILSISKSYYKDQEFDCHLNSNCGFGRLPVIKSDIIETGIKKHPYQAETVINGIKYFYLFSKEEC